MLTAAWGGDRLVQVFSQDDAGLRPAGSVPLWEIISQTTPWFQEALRDHGFGPHQSDGHVLTLSCLRTAVEGDVLVIDDQPTLEVVGDRLTWTDSFARILNSALTRMGGGDPNAGDPMAVHELMVNLLGLVPRGPDPTTYSERQLRWEIVDREKWVKSFTPSPITNCNLSSGDTGNLRGLRRWDQSTRRFLKTTSVESGQKGFPPT